MSNKNEQEELKKINQKLRLGYALELKKPEIDKFERAAILKKIMQEHNWSQRQLALNLAVPKSTIEDWLLYSKLTEKKYDELTSKGVTREEIYKTLRTKTKSNEEGTTIEGFTTIDYKITKFETDINEARNRGDFSKYTKDLITELIPVLQKFNNSIRARK